MVAMAAGYTMNTSPGPSVATSCTSRPDACAIYPSTLKITKPATKEVAELIRLVKRASLEHQIKMSKVILLKQFLEILLACKKNALTDTRCCDTCCRKRTPVVHQNQVPKRRRLE